MSLRRTTAVLSIAVLLLTAGCLGPLGLNGDDADDGPDETDALSADELVEKAHEAEAEIESIHGVQTTTIDDADGVESATFEIWHRSPSETRMEAVELDDGLGDPEIMVMNGSTTWTYDGETNQAMRMDLGFDFGEAGEAMDEFTDDLSAQLYENMTAERAGTDTIADRDVTIVELTADGGDSMYESMTLWIDDETYYPLKQVAVTDLLGSEMTTTIEFEEFSPNVEIDDERFVFEAPDGVEIIDFDDLTNEEFDDAESANATVPFALPEPEPSESFAFDSAYVSENLQGWSASLGYENETGNTLSVSVADGPHEDPIGGETVQIGDSEATLTSMEGVDYRSVQWSDGDLRYIVSGDVTEETLIEVAESIVDS
ncbi:outer membrane lipoprotein-sorting protein [Halovivax gelatinilyticus]|uniref:outer membrane lipoprotein-sorting protein n=1 Tax=Halovivax gelatinilyticus TaxID=2961597 RepID=UPI0020CA2E40|nr:outer membrane lipoprotein-sorting protein [Halovivax gelatinilyticus]